MTSHADLVHRVAAAIIGFARRPSKWLLSAAGIALGVFTALALIIVVNADGWASWIPLILAAAMAVPVITLAVRRQRLLAAVDSLGRHQIVRVETEGTIVTTGAAGEEQMADNLGVFAARFTDGGRKGRGLFPNVSVVQSMLLRSLGGTVNAPYLRDDLSVTFAVTLATLLIIPIAAAGSVILAVIALVI